MSLVTATLTLLAALSVTACATRGPATASPSTTASASMAASPSRTSASTRFFAMFTTDPTAADRLDPKRMVSEQDCTKPVSEDGGVLLCR